MGFAAFVFLAVRHGWVIFATVDNVPFWDEWAFIREAALNPHLNWRWLWEPHNEHRMVVSKAAVWMLYWLNGWNLPFNLALNYVVYLLAVLLLIRMFGRRAAADPWLWMRVSVTGAVLVAMLLISAGRAYLGEGQSKAGRYFELLMPLIPFAAANWMAVVPARYRVLTLAVLWGFLAIGFADNFGGGAYREHQRALRQGGECIRTHYRQGGEADCPTIEQKPIAARLDYAKKIGLSFTREWQ